MAGKNDVCRPVEADKGQEAVVAVSGGALVAEVAARAGGESGERHRVALVVSHLKGGGKEQCVVDLANTLSEGCFEPIVICLQTSGALQDRIRHQGVKVISLDKRPGNDLRLPFRLARVLRRERVDIVHSNNWGSLAESVLAAKCAGVRPIVHTQHGLEYEVAASRLETGRPFRTLVKRVAARSIGRIAAVSHEVREMIVREWRVPPEKVSVIHNGVLVTGRTIEEGERVEVRRQFGLSRDDYVIGSVGIFRPVKDFPTLVHAMAEVLPRLPNAKLVLVGDGPSRPEVEQAADRHGLRSAVRFLGMRQDVHDLLPLMDLFVLCSLSEGLSLSILEAMAAGLPVVATAVGGNPEIIDKSETGLLIPPRSPSETASAILSLSQDADRRRTMGRLARERVRSHFSVQRMASDYRNLYASVVG